MQRYKTKLIKDKSKIPPENAFFTKNPKLENQLNKYLRPHKQFSYAVIHSFKRKEFKFPDFRGDNSTSYSSSNKLNPGNTLDTVLGLSTDETMEVFDQTYDQGFHDKGSNITNLRKFTKGHARARYRTNNNSPKNRLNSNEIRIYKARCTESHYSNLLKNQRQMNKSGSEWKVAFSRGTLSMPNSPTPFKVHQSFKLKTHSKLKLSMQKHRSPIMLKDNPTSGRPSLNTYLNQTLLLNEESRINRPNILNISISSKVIPKSGISTPIGFQRRTLHQRTMQRCLTSQDNLAFPYRVKGKGENLERDLGIVLKHVEDTEKKAKEADYQQAIEKENRDHLLFNINWKNEMEELKIKQQNACKQELNDQPLETIPHKNENSIKRLTNLDIPNRYFQLVPSIDNISTENKKKEENKTEKRIRHDELIQKLVQKYDHKLRDKLTTSCENLKIVPIRNSKKEIVHKLGIAVQMLKTLNLTPTELMEKDIFPKEAFRPKGVIKLFKAIKEANEKSVQEILVENPYFVFSFDNLGQTPLHWSAKRYNMNIMRMLLNHNANPNALDIVGRTPLYMAAKAGYICPVKMLLRKHANPNLVTNMDYTPLDNTQNKAIVRLIHQAEIFHSLFKLVGEKNKKIAWETEGEELFKIRLPDIEDDEIRYKTTYDL